MGEQEDFLARIMRLQHRMSKVISENQNINAKVRSLHKKLVCSSNYQGLLLLTVRTRCANQTHHQVDVMLRAISVSDEVLGQIRHKDKAKTFA